MKLLMSMTASMFMLCLVFVAVAVAQTLTTDASVPQKSWEILLKLAFPVLLTAVGPFVTGFVKGLPAPAKYVIASLASMLVGAGAGAIPDFPLSIESGATMGATAGAVGQKLFMTTPEVKT